tara:strand:- start:1512 stop:1664 length:153 start_codon:yes stop_codon:yes gene_type:complete
MKNIEKQLEKIGDKQHYIHDDVQKIVKNIDDTYDKIMEALERILSKLGNE